MGIQEMTTALNALGDDALMAFIIFNLIDFVEVMTIFGLLTWGIRTGWKTFKKHEGLD